MLTDGSILWYDWLDDDETWQQVIARRRLSCPHKLSAGQLEALTQLRKTTWDGYLISKQARSELVALGLVVKIQGWQVISREGLAVLDVCGLLENENQGATTTQPNFLPIPKATFTRLRKEGLLRD